MKVGTKSVLFGAHQFLIHPWFVAWAWWKLYGFPLDPRLWVAFFVHDLGYFGKPNMDGPEGERHVEFGASVMSFFDKLTFRRCPKCGSRALKRFPCHDKPPYDCINGRCDWYGWFDRWKHFALYHSRFYAKRDGVRFSRLCVADKLAIVLTPAWLYLPLARLTGEIDEYMKLSKGAREQESKYVSMSIYHPDQRRWYQNVRTYLSKWVDEHRDGRADTWTPVAAERKALNESGVWQ